MEINQPLSKEAIRKEIEHSLGQLDTLKLLIGKKRYLKRIRKASKMLTAGLPKQKKQAKKAKMKATKQLI